MDSWSTKAERRTEILRSSSTAERKELRHQCHCRGRGFAMIDDMASLKQAMEQMDAEDVEVAQAGRDRAAQLLRDAKLSFSKMAELIEQRRLLLRPKILTSIKRMDQPEMLGDAAFHDAGSALRREGQSFRQIAESLYLFFFNDTATTEIYTLSLHDAQPTSPRAPSTRAYASPLGMRTCPTDLTPGREEIGPAGSPSSTWRTTLIDSRNSTIRTR